MKHIAFAVLIAASPAFAIDGAVSTSMSPLTFAVADLTPSDGVAASYTLVGTLVDVVVGRDNASDAHTEYDFDSPIVASVPGAMASFDPSFAVSASGTTPVGLLAHIGGAVFSDGLLTLAPHTSLTITGNGAIAGTFAQTKGIDAYALLSVKDFNDVAIAEFKIERQLAKASFSVSQPFSLTVTNATDSAEEYLWREWVHAALLPVPEPSSALLMALGLMCFARVGSRALRRSRD